MQIRFGRKFAKQYTKTEPKIRAAFDKRLKLFASNPYSSPLNNHALTGKFQGYRSINITGDWRAIYSEIAHQRGEQIVTFELVGTHSQLYR